MISIIIPVYNVEQYIRECLDSIVKQSSNDWEAIIVDDGSTDHSLAICEEFALSNSHIKVFHQENGGVSKARNLGIEKASGEWIWFVDGDDWIEPYAIMNLSDIISNNYYDTIFFGIRQFGLNTETYLIPPVANDNKELLLKTFICNTHQAILYQRSIIEHNNLSFTLGMKMSEDLEFQYKYLLHCNAPTTAQLVLYNLRIRNESASHNSQSTYNSYCGNKLILKNILTYLDSCSYKGLDWLGIRIEQRIKNYIKAAFRLKSIYRKSLQSEIRFIIDRYKSIGYKEFNNKTIKLIYINYKLYYLFYKIKHLINRI